MLCHFLATQQLYFRTLRTFWVETFYLKCSSKGPMKPILIIFFKFFDAQVFCSAQDWPQRKEIFLILQPNVWRVYKCSKWLYYWTNLSFFFCCKLTHDFLSMNRVSKLSFPSYTLITVPKPYIFHSADKLWNVGKHFWGNKSLWEHSWGRPGWKSRIFFYDHRETKNQFLFPFL